MSALEQKFGAYTGNLAPNIANPSELIRNGLIYNIFPESGDPDFVNDIDNKEKGLLKRTANAVKINNESARKISQKENDMSLERFDSIKLMNRKGEKDKNESYSGLKDRSGDSVSGIDSILSTESLGSVKGLGPLGSLE